MNEEIESVIFFQFSGIIPDFSKNCTNAVEGVGGGRIKMVLQAARTDILLMRGADTGGNEPAQLFLVPEVKYPRIKKQPEGGAQLGNIDSDRDFFADLIRRSGLDQHREKFDHVIEPVQFVE